MSQMQDVQTYSQRERPMLSRLFGLILAKLLSPLTSFLIIVLVARIWGRTDLGQYNTVLAWLAIFQFVSIFGISEYISREIGKNFSSGAKYLAHALFFGLISSLICVGLMAGGAIIFKYPEELRYGIMTASLALPFSAWIVSCHAVFVAYQKIKYIGLASAVENLFILLTSLIVVIKGYGLIALIWALVIARLLAAALNLFIIQNHIHKLRFQIDWEFFWKLLSPVAVFGLTGIAHQIFMRVDIIMLSRMKNMVTVGLYSSASKLMEICLMLPLAFCILNLPIVAGYYKNFREAFHQKIEAYSKDLFICVFFLFGFGALFSESILRFIFGQAFVEAAWLLRILMLSFLIHSAEMVLGMSSQAAGYHKYAMFVGIFRAVSNVVLNFIFIPLWGALGAATATLISISLSFLIFHFFVKRTLHRFQWIRIALKPALVCLIIMFVLFPLADQLNILLLGSLYFFGYGFTFLGLHGFSPARAFTSIPR